jgi:hypothetical protein
MNSNQFYIPEFIQVQCGRPAYMRWLQGRAAAHVNRDKKRFAGREYSGSGLPTVRAYKVVIHNAVVAQGSHDPYTGEKLDWSLVGKYDNSLSKKRGAEYKRRFRLLPTVDHVLDEMGRPEFDSEGMPVMVICSWCINDSKNDLSEKEFFALCGQVWSRHKAGLSIHK